MATFLPIDDLKNPLIVYKIIILTTKIRHRQMVYKEFTSFSYVFRMYLNN